MKGALELPTLTRAEGALSKLLPHQLPSNQGRAADDDVVNVAPTGSQLEGLVTEPLRLATTSKLPVAVGLGLVRIKVATPWLSTRLLAGKWVVPILLLSAVPVGR